MKENNDNYKANNVAKISAQKAKYREQNKEKIAEKQREYFKENKDRINKYRKQNSESISGYVATYKKNNPEKVSGFKRNYAARKRGAEGKHCADDVDFMLAAQNNLCNRCGCSLILSGPLKFHVDHIVPLSKGGTNWPFNLQILCRTCNLSKGNRT